METVILQAPNSLSPDYRVTIQLPFHPPVLVPWIRQYDSYDIEPSAATESGSSGFDTRNYNTAYVTVPPL